MANAGVAVGRRAEVEAEARRKRAEVVVDVGRRSKAAVVAIRKRRVEVAVGRKRRAAVAVGRTGRRKRVVAGAGAGARAEARRREVVVRRMPANYRKHPKKHQQAELLQFRL